MNEPILLAAARGLTEVLDEVVIVGGSAFRLFPQHPLAPVARDPLLTTEDIDIAVPARGQVRPVEGARLLHAIREAGFDSDPPEGCSGRRTYGYRGPVEMASYLQFITPRGAPGRHASGPRKFGGLELNELRGVHVLLESPWDLELDGRNARLRVVCPAAFLVHKLLVIDTRLGLFRRGKDLVYAYSTIRMFAASLLSLAERVELMNLKAAQKTRIQTNLERVLVPKSDELHEASRILEAVGERALPAAIAATIRAGVAQLL